MTNNELRYKPCGAEDCCYTGDKKLTTEAAKALLESQEYAVVPVDLIEKLKVLLDAAYEYIEYEHNGDPWTEDARAMGEMSLDEINLDEIKAMLTAAKEAGNA